MSFLQYFVYRYERFERLDFIGQNRLPMAGVKNILQHISRCDLHFHARPERL
jgi:hypothetical protein